MFSGSCLCGAIHYEIRGEVARTSHCHCSMCQKQHGAAFASYANVAASDFHLVRGRDALAAYRSSAAVVRTFCQICGSNISWQADSHQQRIAIALGTFDTPYTQLVTHELHSDSKAPWLPTIHSNH
jgi:hypothetical protein